MKTLRDVRRENLARLVKDAGGQKALADLLEKDKNQVWQWGLSEDNPKSRNISDRSARAIEDATGKSPGWLDLDHRSKERPHHDGSPSQSGRPDPETLQASINFLERQFAVWNRVFIAAEQTMLIAGVYERLSAPSAQNLIELTQWVTDQVMGDENEREGEVGSVGSTDRGRHSRRTGAA